MKRTHRPAARAAAVVAVVVAAAAGLLAGAAPAAAHVTVHSTDAVPGGYAVLTFRVPTESSTASTTKLQVQFPPGHPIASVLVQPHPGWTAKTITSKLAQPVTTRDGDTLTAAVSQVVWTADSAATAIKPGQFDQFLVSAGPLPQVRVLTFSAIQTYSDGSVVRWNEVAAAPGSDVRPDHPKPALTLAPAAEGSSAAPAASSGDGGGSDSTALVLAIVALVLAAGALGLGVVSRARQTGR